MSRNLYTIAVVSPSLQRELELILIEDHMGIEPAEQLLIGAVAEPTARVAFFRTLLDGWDRTHGVLIPALAHQLESCGYAWLPPDVPATDLLDREPDASALNACAQEAFAAALRDSLVFGGATRCPSVVLWRVLHASFRDSDFTTS